MTIKTFNFANGFPEKNSTDGKVSRHSMNLFNKYLPCAYCILDTVLITGKTIVNEHLFFIFKGSIFWGERKIKYKQMNNLNNCTFLYEPY